MGKSKFPEIQGGTGGMSPRNVSRGIAAYRHTAAQGTADSGPLPGRDEPPESARPAEARRAGVSPGEGLLKTGNGAARPSGGAEPLGEAFLPQPGEDSKYRRVAKFLILIGGEAAAKIISGLEPEQVELISREIASIRGITAEEGRVILDEFRSLFSVPYGYSGSSSGGVETARRLLYAAFGPERGEAVLHNTLPETRENPFDFLEDFSGEQVALLLREESPAAAALVLSRLSSKLSAAALIHAGPERKLEIVKRIARLGQISPEVLERAASALREKARHIGAAGGTAEIDGKNALAAILKSSDISFGDRILNELEDHDPGLSRELKERLHTLEDVVKAEDRPIQEKLRTMSDRDVVLLLKGRSGEFAEKILANVSAQRRASIREEEEILGPVPRKDTEAAAKEFLAWFRLNREEGRIVLMDDEDVIV
jgi:flagellar motor switch protein FliG